VQHCCVTRGIYEAGQSATRCDEAIVHLGGFFYRDGLTYQDCYTDLDPDACVDLPEAPLAARYAAGPVEANAPPAPPARSFAIVLPELMEGSYQLNVGTPDSPAFVYCTGRGSVVDATSCLMNVCDVTTSNFITVGPPVAGHDCYHTCFH